MIPQITFPSSDFKLIVKHRVSNEGLQGALRTTVENEYNVSVSNEVASKATYIIDDETGEREL